MLNKSHMKYRVQENKRPETSDLDYSMKIDRRRYLSTRPCDSESGINWGALHVGATLRVQWIAKNRNYLIQLQER